MKSLAYSFVLFLLVWFSAGQSETKITADFQQAAHWFDYDSKQPFDIHDKVMSSSLAGPFTTSLT